MVKLHGFKSKRTIFLNSNMLKTKLKKNSRIHYLDVPYFAGHTLFEHKPLFEHEFAELGMLSCLGHVVAVLV